MSGGHNSTDGDDISLNEPFLEQPHYADYSELKYELFRLVSNYPTMARMYSIGASWERRELWVLQLRKDVNTPRPLLMPMFKYVANIHGDETLGRQLLIYLAKYLLYNYETNDEVRQLLDTIDIHLLPAMNPDGFERSPKGEFCDLQHDSGGRENAHGMDLNRDFRVGTGIRVEPEAVAVMQWTHNNPFVLSANFHGGAIVASYPYDNMVNGSFETADNHLFRELALTFAQNHRLMHTGDNCDLGEVFLDGITNGGRWYELAGGMQDFNYIYTNCFEITVEMSCCKKPAAATLPDEWLNNKKSLIEYMKMVHIGMRGMVTDDIGNPIFNAEVVVSEILGKTVKTSKRGEYWRLLLPGLYHAYASADGFVPSKPVEVIITEENFARVDFKLKRAL